MKRFILLFLSFFLLAGAAPAGGEAAAAGSPADDGLPASPITLLSPDSLRTDVVTTLCVIEISVVPGSSVTVNGMDVSGTVSPETGLLRFNAAVLPIGDNVFTFTVRAPHCRESALTVTLYREPQEIPLELGVGTYGATDQKHMRVSAATLPGASVDISSPHTDLDTSELALTGKFSFTAVFDKIGTNRITIQSSYPGLKSSVVCHDVYYLPPPDEYTRLAWPLTGENYADLLACMEERAAASQVYAVTGVVQYFVSGRPWMAVVSTGEDGQSRPVVIQNWTDIPLEAGQPCLIYADAWSAYDGMPWLNARYVCSPLTD